MTARKFTDLEFEPWIEHVFSHAVSQTGNAWYYEIDSDFWDGPPGLTVEHMTRLFENPEPPLEYFADSQIAQGLYYIINSGAGGLVLSLMNDAVPIGERVRCIKAIHPLFRQLIEPRVAPVLGHLDEKGAKALNSVAYMWWDIFPVAAKVERNSAPDPLNAAILGVMENVLDTSHPAIQESALHGLGHWARAYPSVVEPIIDAFIASGADFRPELIAYAKSARQGCVL